jgi:hypothetical protein
VVARELEISLPGEFNAQQRLELAEEITGHVVNRYGVAASVAIHEPDTGPNFHAHILFSTRRLSADGFTEKTRELDDKKQGPVEVLHIRQTVETLTNAALERHGHASRIDSRSLVNQGLTRLATIHEFHDAARRRENEEIRATNARVAATKLTPVKASQVLEKPARAFDRARMKRKHEKRRAEVLATRTQRATTARLAAATVADYVHQLERLAGQDKWAAKNYRARATAWEKKHWLRAWLGRLLKRPPAELGRLQEREHVLTQSALTHRAETKTRGAEVRELLREAKRLQSRLDHVRTPQEAKPKPGPQPDRLLEAIQRPPARPRGPMLR